MRIPGQVWCNESYERREFVKVLVESPAAEGVKQDGNGAWLLVFLEPTQQSGLGKGVVPTRCRGLKSALEVQAG